MTIHYSKLLKIPMIQTQKYADERGFFAVNFHKECLNKLSIPDFVQENHSRSYKNVLRGMHYQNPNAQGKLIRVIQGVVQDVVVDLRKSSSTFGQYESFLLGENYGTTLYVPPGFAHGFLTLSNSVDFLYLITEKYDPASEHYLLWNDSDVNIDWEIKDNLLISPKDQTGKLLKDLKDNELFV